MARLKDPFKRQLILDSALDLMARRGYHAVSVKDIAKEAEISLGSMYTYFESKEQLVNELYRHWKGVFTRFVGLASPEDLPKTQVMTVDEANRAAHKHLCRQLGGFMQTYPKAFQFLEAQFHAEYLDSESLALEEAVTTGAIQFYGSVMGGGADPAFAQMVVSASYGAFIQVFKACQAGVLTMSPELIDRLEIVVWQMLRTSLLQL
jgi:AcrR family transcriptional regulator